MVEREEKLIKKIIKLQKAHNSLKIDDEIEKYKKEIKESHKIIEQTKKDIEKLSSQLKDLKNKNENSNSDNENNIANKKDELNQKLQINEVKKNQLEFLKKSNDNFNAMIDSIIYILIEKLEYKYPNLEKKLSIFFFWFFKYLISTRRYSFILTYFSKLSHIDTNLAKFALKPLYYINGYKDGLKFIATLLTCNTNHSLICEEIEFLIVLNKYEDALKLGKYLTVLNPGFNEAWISLAQVYLKLKKYDKCLKALNNLNYLKTFLHMII